MDLSGVRPKPCRLDALVRTSGSCCQCHSLMELSCFSFFLIEYCYDCVYGHDYHNACYMIVVFCTLLCIATRLEAGSGNCAKQENISLHGKVGFALGVWGKL